MRDEPVSDELGCLLADLGNALQGAVAAPALALMETYGLVFMLLIRQLSARGLIDAAQLLEDVERLVPSSTGTHDENEWSYRVRSHWLAALRVEVLGNDKGESNVQR